METISSYYQAATNDAGNTMTIDLSPFSSQFPDAKEVTIFMASNGGTDQTDTYKGGQSVTKQGWNEEVTFTNTYTILGLS